MKRNAKISSQEMKLKVGQLIKVHREKLNLMQKDVSDELGYGSAQFISNWERGISMPPRDAFLPLCKLLQIDPEKFRKLIEKEYINDIRSAFVDNSGVNVDKKGKRCFKQ